MCQALGGLSLFITTLYLCTDMIIIIVIFVILVVMSAYVALEVLLRAKKDEHAAAEKIHLVNDNTDEEDIGINI